ncbi:MAG: hypothetical protein AVDCRST_MAG70-508 [uncultured Thermomicrobiales bacterium]|uniref:Uncharacterized protein n=1 Tax=uncultured Thermomicrobiales bacterium TaxID=1645740 RepID=A0A6J4UBF6_9BACT|nr:MAG: hypothetical protein AVDCRST_MAG70-508 [uncultured Thermomicrobiales bacterium]
MRDNLARSRTDPDAWEDSWAEVVIWDARVGDALEREGPYVSGQERGDDLGAAIPRITR